MSTRTAGFLEPIQHLPGGAALVFHDVRWDDYEEVLHDLGDHRRLRITFDSGRLEVVSPKSDHDDYIRFIDCFRSSPRNST